MSAVLASIQDEVAKRLTSDSWFAGIEVITEDKGDIEKAISIAVARLGLSILIKLVQARCASPNIPGPYFEGIDLIVEIAENVTINRGPSGMRKTALEAAERVCARCHHFKPEGVSEAIVCDEEAITMAPPPKGASSCYHVALTTQGGLSLS